MRDSSLVTLVDIDGWEPVASGQAELNLTLAPAPGELALRMDFDFKGGGGFVVAHKRCQRAMPEEYVIRFRLRGRGPVNHLELKLLDGMNQNVWRWQRKDFRLPEGWCEMQVRSQEVEFAWGPAGGGAMTKVSAIELAIVAGEGGRGSVWVSDFRIENQSFAKVPEVHVSSMLAGHGQDAVLDELPASCWKAGEGDAQPWIVLDSHAPRVLGGLVIDWENQAPASGFLVSGSNDGRRWKTLYATDRAGGRRSYVYLPGTKVRHLRLKLNEPAGVVAMRVQSFEFSRSIESFFHAVAKLEPRGWHPRWLHREQSLWTPIGVPLGPSCALINEQGLVEVDEGTFSIEPFVWVDGRLFSWADVTIRQELLQGWMPVPSVFWEGEGWRLQIQIFAGPEARHLRYRFENHSDKQVQMKLFAALRPFQVTPPWQRFRNLGGVSPIHDLAWRDGIAWVNESRAIIPVNKGARFGAMSFDEGCLPDWLAQGQVPVRTEVHDTFGYASGAIAFEYSVMPGGTAEADLEMRSPDKMEVQVRAAQEPQVAWLLKLASAQLQGASWAMDAIQTQLTATAHILITQSGPALQPGPRRYTRSWIRDGTIMSAALLRMGCTKEVREFIRWYAPFQRADGFVPCCVDRDGVDWLVEHDSHGQLIALIMDDHYFTRDIAFLAEMWPTVSRAAGCIKNLFGADGLLPVSVSHEGYLAHPVHSFWDDFWALRGLRDAGQIAQVLGHVDEAVRWQALGTRFATALFAAIEATRVRHALNYTPASIEWADFDPAATANAITLLDLPPELDRQALDWTFDKYLADWRKKRTGELPWTRYTAYEIRIIGAFVRMGRRDEALEMLKIFLADRRPFAWNQWPEITWHDPLSPGHVGDVPHTWIGAEYVLALRSLFVFESETRNALVLAAGVAPEWLAGDGVLAQGLRTIHGNLSYRLVQGDHGSVCFDIEGGLTVPPGGLLLRPPLTSPVARVTVNGEGSSLFTHDEVVILKLPALVSIETAALTGIL